MYVRTMVGTGMLLLLTALLSIGLSAALLIAKKSMPRNQVHWQNHTLAPAPEDHPQALIQVYAARAYGWRGILGVHSWIAYKPAGATEFTRAEVIGWGVGRGSEAIRLRQGAADRWWAGNPPQLIGQLVGVEAQAAIPRLEEIISGYPHRHVYTLWPGPNSNSFIAHLLRRTPGLNIDLPPVAIGKDYLVDAHMLAPAPSRTGYQLSLKGLLGFTLARREGLEINILGLTWGLDLLAPAVKLPGLGRLGISRAPAPPA